MKASRSSLSDTRQSFSSGWIGMVKKPSCMGWSLWLSPAYLMACGLMGEPVPPGMMSGAPQKKNS